MTKMPMGGVFDDVLVKVAQVFQLLLLLQLLLDLDLEDAAVFLGFLFRQVLFGDVLHDADEADDLARFGLDQAGGKVYLVAFLVVGLDHLVFKGFPLVYDFIEDEGGALMLDGGYALGIMSAFRLFRRRMEEVFPR